MFFKKARKELRRNFRTRGTGYFGDLGQQNFLVPFSLEVCVVGEGPKLVPLILGCVGVGQLALEGCYCPIYLLCHAFVGRHKFKL